MQNFSVQSRQHPLILRKGDQKYSDPTKDYWEERPATYRTQDGKVRNPKQHSFPLKRRNKVQKI